MYLDVRPWEVLQTSPAQLVDELDLVFMSGQMPDAMRSALINYLNALPATASSARVREAVLAIVLSPQQAIQR